MTRNEFSNLAKALKTFYPRDNMLPNMESMELWYRELQDISYKVAETALRQYVATNRFSPTIADIREQALKITDPTITNDYGDGWEQVLGAVRKYGYYNVDEALASMDEVTRKCVKRLGWKNICMSENPIADRANFRQIYEQEKVKRKELQQLPDKVKQAIDLIQGEEVKQIEAC